MASADQQNAAGPEQQEDQKDEDVAMETEDQDEELHAAEIDEMKPEQLDSTKASRKGDVFLFAKVKRFSSLTSRSLSHRRGQRRAGGAKTR